MVLPIINIEDIMNSDTSEDRNQRILDRQRDIHMWHLHNIRLDLSRWERPNIIMIDDPDTLQYRCMSSRNQSNLNNESNNMAINIPTPTSNMTATRDITRLESDGAAWVHEPTKASDFKKTRWDVNQPSKTFNFKEPVQWLLHWNKENPVEEDSIWVDCKYIAKFEIWTNTFYICSTSIKSDISAMVKEDFYIFDRIRSI